MTTDEYRLTLLKIFWSVVNKYTGKQFGYEFAESLYPDKVSSFPAKGISSLTVDELRTVVAGLCEKSGANYTVPVWKKEKKKGKANNMEGWATDGQLDRIKIMAADIGLSRDALRNLAKKMNGGNEVKGKCPIKVAQKMLNALKGMKVRGWKPTGKPAVPAKAKKEVRTPPAQVHPAVVRVRLDELKYQGYVTGKHGTA